MNTKEKEQLWRLFDITNKMGGRNDYTAVSPIKLMRYSEAYGKVSKIIAHIINNDNEEECEKLLYEMDALSRWNFKDRNGRISDEEVRCNQFLKKRMNGWTPESY